MTVAVTTTATSPPTSPRQKKLNFDSATKEELVRARLAIMQQLEELTRHFEHMENEGILPKTPRKHGSTPRKADKKQGKPRWLSRLLMIIGSGTIGWAIGQAQTL